MYVASEYNICEDKADLFPSYYTTENQMSVCMSWITQIMQLASQYRYVNC